MPVTQETYERIVLERAEDNWEVHQGRLREKPSMTFAHNDGMFEIGHQLRHQLDRRHYRVRVNAGHVRRTERTYYIPDVCVLPIGLTDPFRDRSDVLEVYDAPLPLVVEVWSPSTGDYDIDAKLPEYRKRGDLEIWRLHPFDRVLTVWRRQPGGAYIESVHTGGTVEVGSLPGVTVDLDAFFA